MGRARLTIPFSVAGGGGAAGGRGAPDRRVAADRPVARATPPAERERLAVAYVPDPKAKGLDVLVAGWAAAAIEGARLEVLRARPGVGALAPAPQRHRASRTRSTWRGTVARRRSSAPRCAVRASSSHGARWEDWGQAPLEALADGALLATGPLGRPVRGRCGSRAQLDPSLVADADRPAPRWRPRSARPSSCRTSGVRAYRERAAEAASRPYRSEAVQETVATRELLCSSTLLGLSARPLPMLRARPAGPPAPTPRRRPRADGAP